MNEFWRALVDFQQREVLVVALCEAANDREWNIARCPRPVRSYPESGHSLPRMGVWFKRSAFGNYFRYDRFIIFV